MELKWHALRHAMKQNKLGKRDKEARRNKTRRTQYALFKSRFVNSYALKYMLFSLLFQYLCEITFCGV